jgi:multidrug efflux pump subunit AcrA (membrane-fusion protein)
MESNQIRALSSLLLLFSCLPSAHAQTQAPNPPPVPYSSVSQLNSLLSQLDQASQAAQLDLAKLRIDKWKTDSSNKRQTQANVESIQRNLQSAMPEIVGQLHSSPEDLTATFKLYRNLDALYDVFGSVVESAGAFGSKEEFQTLENDLGALEKTRRSFADRVESLSGAKEAELARLRTALQNAQANANQPPKKVVVDDTEPPKKPVKKKAAPKSSTSTPQPPADKPQ